MNRQQLTRIAGAFAVALLLWAVLAVVRRPPSDHPDRLVLPKVDTAAVDTVSLARLHDTTLLVRANGGWRANGYPAASETIAELLRGLADTSAWSELMAESKTSYDRLGVGADSGQHVLVKAHGHAVLDLTSGKRTPDNSGVYVRQTSAEPVYALHGGIAPSLGKPADEWRDTRIVAIAPESVATIAIQHGKQSYTLHRAKAGWQFADGRSADSTAVSTLLGSYRDLRASGFAPTTSFAGSGARARLTGKSGAALVNLVFDSTAAGVLARADSGGTVFRLESWMLGQLMPADSTLRVKNAKNKA
jgi:Domain of unknown function (DUF4340)